MKQLFCGLDVHRQSHTGCIMDQAGSVVSEHTFPATKKALEQFIGHLPSGQVVVAIEACGCWRGAWKHLTAMGYQVKLANPLQTHAIAVPHKTDQVDARILADLLRTGYLPEVWIPSEETLRLRDITRHKATLVRLRTQVQTRIKAYLLREGIEYRDKLWTKTGVQWLQSLELEFLSSYVRMYEAYHQEELAYDKVLRSIGSTRSCSLLRTIPGVGAFCAPLITGEVGDVKRFATRKKFAAYCGLAKGRYQSAGTDRAMTRRGYNHWLKWALVLCSG